MTTTDPTLWARRPVFGPAGGPFEVVLTDQGNALAFSVGAQVRLGGPVEALAGLGSTPQEEVYLSVGREGAHIKVSELGRFSEIVWAHLRALGFVESFYTSQGTGVRLTEPGRRAVLAGIEERSRLLNRCRRDLP